MSTTIFRGMIHFSDRDRMDILAAPALEAYSRASTAEAPPPMMASFLPLAFLLARQR